MRVHRNNGTIIKKRSKQEFHGKEQIKLMFAVRQLQRERRKKFEGREVTQVGNSNKGTFQGGRREQETKCSFCRNETCLHPKLRTLRANSYLLETSAEMGQGVNKNLKENFLLK